MFKTRAKDGKIQHVVQGYFEKKYIWQNKWIRSFLMYYDLSSGLGKLTW
jgi:hypothetical protein